MNDKQIGEGWSLQNRLVQKLYLIKDEKMENDTIYMFIKEQQDSVLTFLCVKGDKTISYIINNNKFKLIYSTVH